MAACAIVPVESDMKPPERPPFTPSACEVTHPFQEGPRSKTPYVFTPAGRKYHFFTALDLAIEAVRGEAVELTAPERAKPALLKLERLIVLVPTPPRLAATDPSPA